MANKGLEETFRCHNLRASRHGHLPQVSVGSRDVLKEMTGGLEMSRIYETLEWSAGSGLLPFSVAIMRQAGSCFVTISEVHCAQNSVLEYKFLSTTRQTPIQYYSCID
jgi:hypothetical protein